jgi:hypothetical protein
VVGKVAAVVVRVAVVAEAGVVAAADKAEDGIGSN